MRLVVTPFVLLSLVASCHGFVPLRRHTAFKKTALQVIPPNVNVNIDLPQWLVDNGNVALNLLENAKAGISLPVLPSQPEELIASLAIGVIGLGASLVAFLNGDDNFDDAPYEPGTDSYSAEKASEFYGRRKLLVAKRVIRLVFLTGAFNTGLLFDWLVLGKLLKDEEFKALRRNEPWRAKQALRLCEQLGPTFIKLGQAVSIRTDLVPEAYALELRQLQDAVPPFDSDKAYEVLRAQLGVQDLSTVFSSLSTAPVASASIGQVYRGTLSSNEKDVAVKVQRPGILAEIALDLHVLRILTPVQTVLQNLANGVKTSQEDIDSAIGLVDEWGRGFVAETDYRLEAKNTIEFEKAMRKRGLDAVCAPTVVQDLVRDTVLVTEWVEGTRLDRDASADVPRLCGVAINAYLTMLLDTGVLHCDPHPGNLLRTTDGKLCVLDWGMTLAVPPDLQYALLELIAHINSENYQSIPQDFINLGFSPEGVTADRLKDSGITEGLTFAFQQLSQGGGPKKIQERVKADFQQRYGEELSDKELQEAARSEMVERMEVQLEAEGVDVKGVTNVMEEMSRRNRELFTVPPYVLYVARAFSTLEGIGLSIDEDYSIVQECYPYLAQRLFTDRSPRAKKALRAMLGLSEDPEGSSSLSVSGLAAVQAGTKGEAPHVTTGGSLSPSKLMEMSEGFTSYTAATTDVDRDGAGQAAATAEFAKLLLDPKGSTLQDILVEETARLGDAATRAALRSSLIDNPAAKAASAALRAQKEFVEQSPLAFLLPGPLKAALVDRPSEIPDLIDQLLASNEEDERILSTATELQNIVTSQFANNNGGGDGTAHDKEGSEDSGIESSSSLASMRSLLDDEVTRKLILEQGPGVASLGRRVGAGLLRRAAYRANQSGALPEETRKALADANLALANALDDTATTDNVEEAKTALVE